MNKQIIFFDGVCSLCNGFADFVVRRDAEGVFQLASLQGSTAKATLPPEHLSSLASIVLYSQGQVFTQSDAVLMILGQLGGIWSLAKIFWVVPATLRDLVYRLVAKNRYAWFGKRDTCRLPTPQERGRFLE